MSRVLLKPVDARAVIRGGRVAHNVPVKDDWILRTSPDIHGGLLPPNRCLECDGVRVRFLQSRGGNRGDTVVGCVPLAAVQFYTPDYETAQEAYQLVLNMQATMRCAKALYHDELSKLIDRRS